MIFHLDRLEFLYFFHEKSKRRIREAQERSQKVRRQVIQPPRCSSNAHSTRRRWEGRNTSNGFSSGIRDAGGGLTTLSLSVQLRSLAKTPCTAAYSAQRSTAENNPRNLLPKFSPSLGSCIVSCNISSFRGKDE